MTTFQLLKKQFSLKNIVIGYIRETKEFRVNFKNGSDSTAYYTDDLQDAINTANHYIGVKR